MFGVRSFTIYTYIHSWCASFFRHVFSSVCDLLVDLTNINGSLFNANENVCEFLIWKFYDCVEKREYFSLITLHQRKIRDSNVFIHSHQSQHKLYQQKWSVLRALVYVATHECSDEKLHHNYRVWNEKHTRGYSLSNSSNVPNRFMIRPNSIKFT